MALAWQFFFPGSSLRECQLAESLGGSGGPLASGHVKKCDFLWTSTHIYIIYHLVMTNIAIENDPVEIVDFPIENDDFP